MLRAYRNTSASKLAAMADTLVAQGHEATAVVVPSESAEYGSIPYIMTSANNWQIAQAARLADQTARALDSFQSWLD